MEGVAVGALGDLLAATESVGDDEPVGGRFPDRGEEFEFSDGREIRTYFISLEAEGSGHAAASGRRGLEVDAEAVRSDSSAVILMMDL